jgi:alpha,alpha-trehalose-phosphate synthase [UDP-forming]/trehalose-phosphatase
MTGNLKALLDGPFIDKELIIVTNRQPYVYKKTPSGVKAEKTAGGLATALDDVMKAVGGTWVAWGSGNADKEVVDDKDTILVPPENPTYTLKLIWLSNIDAENYYHGFSNQVLWPLCHIALERVYFRKRFWEHYKKVNRIFSEGVVDVASKDSIVWVHDYHLCLLPSLLREQMPDLTIAHFWHIPWPDWSVFRVCPHAKELIEGLLGNDLLCFQIPLFVKNFIDCVRETTNAEIDYHHQTIIYKNHLTQVKAFPISIDYEKFNSIASSKKVQKLINKIKDSYDINSKYIAVGVDRLEYTKALIKRLQALDLFFEKYKKLRKDFTYIQISTATRLREPYLSYKKTVERIISEINNHYGTDDWTPIIYIDKKLDISELVSFYRMADLAIISSIYDGMNLVAKEFVASQVEHKGVLILSELAGAADELTGALLINPYDIEGFAETIYKSLIMPYNEKQSRIHQLREQVRDNDIYRWITDILSEVATISTMKNKECVYLFNILDEIIKDIKSKNTFLFLDYDGTLTPIVSTPDKAILSNEMKDLLLELKKHYPIAIITGRSLSNIMEMVGIDGILYAGNHGAEIWDGQKEIISHEVESCRQALKEFIDRLEKEIGDIRGIQIEDKGATASIHYRNVSVKELGRLISTFKRISKDYETIFRITHGKKVFEIRPVNSWHKGDAVLWLLERFDHSRYPIYIGDDTTDEDAFIAIAGKGISIGVGYNCKADYYIKDQTEVKDFLEKLLQK